jgi:hypothetical protein
MEKKYQIFVSSTYNDLKEARDKVIETILKMYHLPVGMEMFSADDAEQWDIIKETIIDSDYYIVIIGQRYGSLTCEGISFTEREYDFAKEQGIPILSFILNQRVPTTPEERDKEPDKIKKLEKFIEKATANKMCDFWNNNDELTTKVSVALTKVFKRSPRIGWVKADKAISPLVSEELAKLSDENRKLKNDIEMFTKNSINKKPNLIFQVNDEQELKIAFNTNYVKMEYLPNDVWNMIVEFTQSSTVNISPSNWELPNKNIIDKFNKDYEIYWRKKNASEQCVFKLANIGNAKANEIFLSVQFPPELLIISEKSISELKTIQFPIKCLNKFSQKHLDSMIKILYPFYFENEIKSESSISPSSRVNITTNTTSVDEKQNNYSQVLGNLVHSLSVYTTEKLKIVPLCRGNFSIDVDIMCEEYDEMKSVDFPIIIQ